MFCLCYRPQRYVNIKNCIPFVLNYQYHTVKMAKRTSVDVREIVIKLHKEGKVSREIASVLAIGKSTVNDIIKKWKTTGTLKDNPVPGRPRITTKRVDKIIKRKAIVDVKKNAAVIARELREENLADISQSTVSRRLTAVGLFGRIGVKKPLISKKNKKARLEFAKAHQHWTIENWKKVLFSDETKINLFGSDGKKYVRRPQGKRNDSRYQTPTVKHGGGSIMIWGAFSWKGVGPIFKIEGNMDSTHYKEIVSEQMLPYARRNMPRGWIFQQDNDPKHRSKLLQEFFTDKKIRVLEWPSQSPDLNPIEHLWQELKLRIGTENCSNKAALWEKVQEEWASICQDRIIKLVESMPRRCAAVIAANGMATKY